jgi:MFS family permease
MIRGILGVIVGLAVAVLTIMAVQAIGHQIYPYPADVDLNDPEQIARVFPTIPVAAKLFVVAAWFFGAMAGAAVAKSVVGSDWAAWTIAVLVACAGVMNLFIIPHPVWMQIAAVVAPLLGGLIANHLVRREPAGPDGERGDAAL